MNFNKTIYISILLIIFTIGNIYSQQPKTIEIKEVKAKEKTPEKKKISPTPKPVTPTKQSPKPVTPIKKTPKPIETQKTIETPPVIEPVVELNVSPPPPKDTIVKMGGKKVPVDRIIKIASSSASVIFVHLDGTQDEWKQKDIEKILYRDGKRKVVFNKPVFQTINQTSWQNIYVTENKDEVAGFFEVGIIKVSSSTSSRTIKDAKKNSITKLQKKAATMGAEMVLIISGNATGGYGEPPGYDIEAMAYSSEKPAPKK